MLPVILTKDLFHKDVKVVIEEPKFVKGNVTLEELVIICKLIKIYRPNRIFEFGTFDGRTTLNMALNSKALSEIYTLDLPSSEINNTKFLPDPRDYKYILKEKSGSRFSNRKDTKNILQLYGDSATFNYLPYKANIDFIFVDGGHSVEHVRNDTQASFYMLKSNGVILWHDYGTRRSVNTVLDEYFQNDVRFKNIYTIDGTTLVLLEVNK